MNRCLQILLLLALAFPASAGGRIQGVKSYLVYYGKWNEAALEKAWAFDLAILHPGPGGNNISAELVSRLRRGKDGKSGTEDDVVVLGYVSIGEDDSVQRGPRPNVAQLGGPVHLGPEGKLVLGGNGFSSWYVDERAVELKSDGSKIWGGDGLPVTRPGQDGLPDENGKWRSYFVYAGDRDWQARIRARMHLVLSQHGCDGLFLDTIDTASPWGAYGWMQDDMARLISSVRDWFPKAVLVMNRGLFLFEKHGEELAKALDGVMFECFTSEWDWCRSIGTRHPWYASNLHLLNSLRPINAKKDGIFLFFLDYVAPEQADRPLFLRSLREGTKGLRNCAYAFSSPDLQGIHAPLTLEPEVLPAVENLKMRRNPGGDYSVDLGKWRQPGGLAARRIFLSASRENENPARPFIPIYDSMLNPVTGRLILPELAPGEWNLLVSLVDENGRMKRLARTSFMVPDEGRLPAATGITAKSGQNRIAISWEPVKDADSYIVLWGENEDPLERTLKNPLPGAELPGLVNGRTYFFRVRAMKGDSKGLLSELFFAAPSDCDPPMPPKDIKTSFESGELVIRWSASESADVSGYYLYLDPAALKRGIPLHASATDRIFRLPLPAAGSYSLQLSAYDANNNESGLTPGEVIEVK